MSDPQETYTEPDEEFRIDEAVLYKTLKLCQGDRAKAMAAFRQSGIQMSRCQLDEAIQASSILRAYFGEDSPIVHSEGMDPESALLRLPDGTGEQRQVSDADMARIVKVQDEYIAARGLRGVGFTDDDIQEMESMAQFVGHGFKKTIDLTHGVMVVQLWNLKKRADEIQGILNNTEERERVALTERGQIVRYTTARFTDQEKLEWQKELTNIVDQIRRIADSSNAGAALRLKAEMAARDIGPAQKVPTKKARRLRKAEVS